MVGLWIEVVLLLLLCRWLVVALVGGHLRLLVLSVLVWGLVGVVGGAERCVLVVIVCGGWR